MLEPFGKEITRDDFLDSGWESIIAEAARKQCVDYWPLLLEVARKTEAEDNRRHSQIFYLLAYVSSLKLHFDTPTKPLVPLFVHGASRSADVDDFDASHFDFLDTVVDDITDSSLQARIADLLWICRQDYRRAQIAVEAYLQCADVLEDFEHWEFPADAIVRAMHIAASLGKNHPLFKKVVRYIDDLLMACNGEDKYLLSYRLMGLLVERKLGDSAQYALMAEKLALRAEAENNWDKARTYWKIKGEWHKVSKSDVETAQARVSAAECCVKYAEDFVNCFVPDYANAADWLRIATIEMRNIDGAQERAAELFNQMLDYEQRSVHQFSPKSKLVDTSKLADMAVQLIKGMALPEALIALAWFCSPPTKAELRKRAIDLNNASGILDLCDFKYSNELGRQTVPSPQDEEDRLNALMYFLATREHGYIVSGILEPVRQQILAEHDVSQNDFMSFVQDNHFVRPGRELIVARGLYAGMQGDMLVAVHLLIPQLEDTVRYILHQNDVIASGLNDNGAQKEYDLNKMLDEETEYAEPLIEIFGEDFFFDFRGLLVDKHGANLRNEMAHGLMSHHGFSSAEIYYCWWMAFRLYTWPAMYKHQLLNFDEAIDNDMEPEIA